MGGACLKIKEAVCQGQREQGRHLDGVNGQADGVSKSSVPCRLLRLRLSTASFCPARMASIVAGKNDRSSSYTEGEHGARPGEYTSEERRMLRGCRDGDAIIGRIRKLKRAGSHPG